MSPISSSPAIGQWYRYLPTGEVFQALCNCPRSEPRHHTQRAVVDNPQLYEPATAPEPRFPSPLTSPPTHD